MNRIITTLTLVCGITQCAEQVVPAMPVEQPAVEPKKVEQIDVQLVPEECVPVTLTTTAPDAQGNWVAKRAFWQQAADAYESMIKANDQLFSLQMEFVTKRNEIDKKTDAAYSAIGLGQGELSELIKLLIEELDQEQHERGDLSESERELMKELHDKQSQLQELAKHVTFLDELDNALDHVQVKVADQIKQCRQYEEQAWANFKKIGLELNDKKAQQLYYQVESAAQNAAAILQYLNNDLMNYQSTTISLLEQEIESLHTTVEKMKQQGIELHEEYARLTQQDIDVELERRAEQEKRQTPPPAPTMFQKVIAWVYGLWNNLLHLLRLK